MRDRFRNGVDVKLLDMTADGRFVPDAARPSVGWPLRLGLGAAFVAVVATGLIIAALFLWLASVLIPVALVAGLVAYAAFRLQRWRITQTRR